MIEQSQTNLILSNQAESAPLYDKTVQAKRSYALFTPSMLEELYFKGYGKLVVKVLVKLKDILTTYQ